MKKFKKVLLVMLAVLMFASAIPAAAAPAKDADGAAKSSSSSSAGSDKSQEEALKTGIFRNPEDGKWYYYRDGGIDRGYTGFAENEKGWWYVKKGLVSRKVNDIIKGVVNGKKAWWYVRNSKVRFIDTIARNKKGNWYRIKDGRVDFKYAGIAKNKNGSWWFSKGRIDKQATGIRELNGTKYLVRRGKIRTDYTGKARSGGKTYKVVKGVATLVNPVLTKMEEKSKKYSSPTGYLILLDRNNTKVGIFKKKDGKWENIQLFSCCVGKASSPTPTGVFHVGIKGQFFNARGGGRCWYYTQIRGNYLFHSQIYDRQSSPRRITDGRINKWCSHGCVRLRIADAKWIYNNIPGGTTICIY